jgi:triacylglycerol lipase
VLAIAGTAIAVLAACAPALPPVPGPPASPRMAAGEVRHPVVFVHGFQLFCGTEDPSAWKVWTDEAARRGYRPDELNFFQYDTCRYNQFAVLDLGAFVEEVLARTGATKVDMVAHSMGSAVARDCIRFARCAGKVDKFDSVAGANHGSIWGNFCGLAFWSRSACDMAPTSPFLVDLNTGDETWGDTQYVTMVSWCDLTVVPYTSVALAGALNIVTPRCVSHTDWRKDELGAKWSFDWFTGSGPPKGAQPVL